MKSYGMREGMDPESREMLKRDLFVQGLLLKWQKKVLPSAETFSDALHQARAAEEQEKQLAVLHCSDAAGIPISELEGVEFLTRGSHLPLGGRVETQLHLPLDALAAEKGPALPSSCSGALSSKGNAISVTDPATEPKTAPGIHQQRAQGGAEPQLLPPR